MHLVWRAHTRTRAKISKDRSCSCKYQVFGERDIIISIFAVQGMCGQKKPLLSSGDGGSEKLSHNSSALVRWVVGWELVGLLPVFNLWGPTDPPSLSLSRSPSRSTLHSPSSADQHLISCSSLPTPLLLLLFFFSLRPQPTTPPNNK